jgi:hypothetical protein
MRNRFLMSIALSIVLLTTSGGCGGHRDNKPSTNAQPDSGNKASSDGGSKPDDGSKRHGADAPPGTLKDIGSTGAEDDGGTEIVRVDNIVAMKKKGARDFEPISDTVQFHVGDTLQIGADSAALVSCEDLCKLGTGTYTACCTDQCKLVVQLMRSGTTGEQPFMLKRDLPPADATALAESESKLLSLGLGKTTTQFLKAKLYTSWRLKEAEEELVVLSEQLEKPEARRELGKIYAPLSLKTGNMLFRIDKKDRAIHEYQKIITNPPEASVIPPDALKEKAAAHAALADVLVEGGKKAEAQENLKAAKSIYVKQGDANKAAAIDKKMKVASKPD